jgi:hypothetical protein
MRIFGGLIGGIFGGLIGAIVISFIVIYVGVPLQKANYHSFLIVSWSALMGLGITAGISFSHILNPQKKMNTFMKIICGAFGGTITGAIGGGLISGTFMGGAILGGIFGIWIMLGIQISESLVGKKVIKTELAQLSFGGVIGGLSAGVTSGLLWGLLAKGAQAEGYLLLATAMLSILGIMLGAGIIVGMYAFKDMEKVEKFTTAPTVFSTYDRSEIIEFVKSKKYLDLSELTALYILTLDKQYALKIKKILLKEAREKRFTNPAHSVKSQQFNAAKRAVSYLEIEKIKGFINREEKEEIVDWFKDITNRAFSVEWVDYLYAIAFKRKPVGPYENQEIGVGALAVFAKIIEEKYPEIAKKCREYIDEHAVVWGGNFRNTDDSVGYQSWWIYNAFLVAKYRPMSEWSSNRNAREAFEWLLKQWPPNGMTLGYNDSNPSNIADTMALGASLFHDGRYKWLAVKMLKQLNTKEDVLFPFYFGLVSWDDSLEPVRPSAGSSYLIGPGGLPHDPGPSMPDKIVFREGWAEDSLYALLNLRYSGWHKYKATNSFVNIIYGKPFIVEDFISKNNKWLPAGRSLYRDKKTDRIRLNGFQVGLEGYELLIYELLKIGTQWAQDPPRYAEVEYFQKTPGVEFSKTNISKWRGWSNERVSILVKNGYFVVFDKAEGKKRGRVAISWHLKGFNKAGRDIIHLKKDRYQMKVFYPHYTDWYRVKLEDSSEEDPPAGDIHAPDVDLYMISDEKSKAGFITLFAPVKSDRPYIVEPINVEDSEGRSVYPDALGITVENKEGKDTVGITFSKNVYKYGSIRTDSELFFLREEQHRLLITYKKGSFFEVDSLGKPSKLTIDVHSLKENVDWKYIDGRLKIKLPEGTGDVKVWYSN